VVQALTPKQVQEKSDLLLTLKLLGISSDELIPGVPDPPDWWVEVGGRRVPVELTRAYADGPPDPPMARLARWRKLKERLRTRQLAPELQLDFRVGSGGAEIPLLRDSQPFILAIEAAVSAQGPVLATVDLSAPAGTEEYLTAVVLRPSSVPGEVLGTPDATFLSVAPESHINDFIGIKQAKLLAGHVESAWLVIVLGVDLASEILGIGELDLALLLGPTDSAVIERVYVVDLASGAALVYQHGRWSAAASAVAADSLNPTSLSRRT
jgi:hypothetical protein